VHRRDVLRDAFAASTQAKERVVSETSNFVRALADAAEDMVDPTNERVKRAEVFMARP
jgi:hypothetical protein